MIQATFRTRPTRVLNFDLENRPLAYWYDGETTSEITAFAWKWLGEDTVQTMLLGPYGRYETGGGKRLPAKRAFSVFRDVLAQADMVVGHNIRRHDLPMFNAGLLRLELEPLGELRTQDTCRDLPRRRGLSYSLENMAEMYGLEGEKVSMSQPKWEDANRLTRTGLEKTWKRVVGDVWLQERLHAKLLSLGLLKPPRKWSS